MSVNGTSALPPAVKEDETLGRYLTDRSYFSSHRVKPKAFEPNRDLALSVMRVDGLDLDGKWNLGMTEVIGRMTTPRTLHGIAEVSAEAVFGQRLEIDPDPAPSSHANVIGWPTDKFRQLSITQELASGAKLVLRLM